MTPLKAANVFFFQWFCIRLTRCLDSRVENYQATSYDLMPDGNIGSRGTGKTVTYQWYSLQFWIVPCTGWWSDFVYLNKKPTFLKITKPKAI